MYYLLTFLEGIITFVSPCLLPMLPVYISFFTGQNMENGVKPKKAFINSIGFVLGFTFIFVLLGAFAGAMGSILIKHRTIINIVTGAIVMLFGLNFLGIVKIPFISHNRQVTMKKISIGFFSSFLFGIVFSISWTPCVGAFLGSALALAASGGESLKGILMLLSFSLGLGIPFIISALLIGRLKTAFNFIKRNYKVINLISGIFLIVIGLLIALGYMGYFLALLTF